jgi:hypothetical protein
MAKKTEKVSMKFDTNAVPAFATVTDFYGSFFESYARAGQVFFENAFGLNQEIARFAGSRFQADMDAFRTLGQCSDWQELLNLQSNFSRSATEAYLAEMPELTEQVTRTCTALCAPVFEAAQELPKAAAKS